MTDVDRFAIALLRYMVIQAARDGDLELANRSDADVRRSVRELLRLGEVRMEDLGSDGP